MQCEIGLKLRYYYYFDRSIIEIIKTVRSYIIVIIQLLSEYKLSIILKSK